MGNIAGQRKGQTYPETGGAGAAAGALRNRNVAELQSLTVPFTPSNSLIAAIAFTPTTSGIIQVSGNLVFANGSDADIYAGAMEVQAVTGLTVTGGEVTSDGWVMGSNTPPVLGGTPASIVLVLEGVSKLGASEPGSMSFFGITATPLPIGVPSLIGVLLNEVGGGHALAGLGIANLSVVELP